MEITKKKLVFAAVAVAALIVLMGLFFNWQVIRERSALEQDRENFAKLEKEAMQDELDRISEDYTEQYNKLSGNAGEMNIQLANDSLLAQLTAERTRVNRLQDELKTVKATNARRIGELRGEIKTLRAVLKSYVVQIDSLNAANERLRTENQEVRRNYAQAAGEASRLKVEKAELTGKVELASKLEAAGISIGLLDKKGRAVKNVAKLKTIQMNFIIPKNITAPVGEKAIYARILTPNDEVLQRSSGDVFPFEGKQIAYSCRKQIEYTGDQTDVVLYWNVVQTLTSGSYRVDFFADGHLIGRKSFKLD
ncbi:hypothetical protein [Porphyromonas loveana]|uniref:Cell division protein ZapB n=1 Tax=Porphyromonas loveana TaxID=1884669 RepID=A0A2U1FPD3_9PORP|nr:hypothetical protein [Porphyromonas loveana]PVZ14019.1 hypothetical protein C7382_10261 [Porphyromonas loveana]